MNGTPSLPQTRPANDPKSFQTARPWALYAGRKGHSMTYQELLQQTAQKKRDAIRELNKALKGPCGFLVKAEIEKNPGAVAYHWLAQSFCETLAEHVEEFMEQTGDIDSCEAREIGTLYMAYEDSDPDLYDLLPVEAQLFAEE